MKENHCLKKTLVDVQFPEKVQLLQVVRSYFGGPTAKIAQSYRPCSQPRQLSKGRSQPQPQSMAPCSSNTAVGDFQS